MHNYANAERNANAEGNAKRPSTIPIRLAEVKRSPGSSATTLRQTHAGIAQAEQNLRSLVKGIHIRTAAEAVDRSENRIVFRKRRREPHPSGTNPASARRTGQPSRKGGELPL